MTDVLQSTDPPIPCATGTKQHYFSQTIVAGGAQYRATGRGFVTRHSTFDELYRFYASSHLYLGFELVVALSLFDTYSLNPSKAAVSWTLWFAAISCESQLHCHVRPSICLPF